MTLLVRDTGCQNLTNGLITQTGAEDNHNHINMMTASVFTQRTTAGMTITAGWGLALCAKLLPGQTRRVPISWYPNVSTSEQHCNSACIIITKACNRVVWLWITYTHYDGLLLHISRFWNLEYPCNRCIKTLYDYILYLINCVLFWK